MPLHNLLIVVIGATGTGKSDLAVDIAKKYNGEIINGDAMQMYAGLPIITNKMTTTEQQGIPHHLLGTISLHEDPWTVGLFKQKAGEIIKEIRSRGNLPILVGGTHYYTQALLLGDSLVDEPERGDMEKPNDIVPREELDRRFPILSRPTEEILQHLTEVDPTMAARWHPNDRRRIQRSLEIYLTTGEKASKIYEEQRKKKLIQKTKEANGNTENEQIPSLPSPLIFWIGADRDVLHDRLDNRVDNMIANGLIDEVTLLSNFLDAETVAGRAVDRTTGIWISIGFKEFEPYISARKHSATAEEIAAALHNSVQRTKTSTRQYARRQLSWIRNKLLTALKAADTLDSMYYLDGTTISNWTENVSGPALNIVHRFLAAEVLPAPQSITPAAKDFLMPKRDHELQDRADLWIREVCELCGCTAVTGEQWQLHLKSRKHRRMVSRATRGHNGTERPVEAAESSNEGD